MPVFKARLESDAARVTKWLRKGRSNPCLSLIGNTDAIEFEVSFKGSVFLGNLYSTHLPKQEGSISGERSAGHKAINTYR